MKILEKKTEAVEMGRRQMNSMQDEELKRLFPDLPAVLGSFGRERIFTLETTFFLFLWQVLSMSSCAAAMQRVLLRLALAGEGNASTSSMGLLH
jgi:hypothetical protein